MILIVAIIFSGQKRTLILSNSVIIQVKEAFTDTHFATKEDLRLWRIKPIKPEKGFISAKHFLRN